MPPPLLPRASPARAFSSQLHHFRLHLRLRPRPSARRFTTCRPSPAARPPRTKPATLAQPDRFRAPSHPAARRPARPRKRLYYGAEPTVEQRATFESKQYPYSFPPPKTFMHWFLTTRSVHVWISLVRAPLYEPAPHPPD
jgi:hypothetical protein